MELSITDTVGPEKSLLYRGSTIWRLFYTHSNISGPIKAVCYREVFAIWEFVLRGPTVQVLIPVV